ncbi:RagB/SusD family nutrient uptake outer membrane protein [Prolixibacteraceae bacterium JC049]|nr:RagB/SusD family nutrient uptake outer membrane protein [Prolixibacteraceae bacterium JC049]
MMTNKIFKIFSYFLIISFFGCQDYLDIVPDDIATSEKSFKMRVNAEKNLFTCFSYLPRVGDVGSDIAMMGGDELWHFQPIHELNSNSFQVGLGNQNTINPYCDYWKGDRGGQPLWQGIRYCNIFLNNIHLTVDLDDSERARWKAEVKFLKAYYHFYLLRMYGPIPFVDENIPIDAGVEEVKNTRQPVDVVVSKIVALLDECVTDLPEDFMNPVDELGRPTQAVAKALKAKVLVTAASPLFNGNEDYNTWKNSKDEVLINPSFDNQKWELAATACKEAIDAAHAAKNELYYFKEADLYDIGDTINTRMNIRQSICDPWNRELIWGLSIAPVNHMQKLAMTRVDPTILGNANIFGSVAPTLNIANKFYTNHGVPIDEDNNWDYKNRFELSESQDQKKEIIPGSVVANYNQFREPRFYASMGIDRGYWFGQGHFSDDPAEEDFMYGLHSKFKEHSGKMGISRFSETGIHLKKLAHFKNVANKNGLSVTQYPFPLIRLADIYLLYAEALNESAGPSAEVFNYIDLVRKRAGLEGVEDAWSKYSKFPSKPASKDGLREIIQQERSIELAFEGQRYWDLRRWKLLLKDLNTPIKGWNLYGKTPEDFYRVIDLHESQSSLKHYFAPIEDSEVLRDSEVGQTFGW